MRIAVFWVELVAVQVLSRECGQELPAYRRRPGHQFSHMRQRRGAW